MGILDTQIWHDPWNRCRKMFGNIQHWATATAVLLSSMTAAMAQESWANALVDTEKLEFGVIATGSEAVKVVVIENTTPGAVHITSVSTGCRCAEVSQPGNTQPQPGNTLLQPGEKTFLEVRMNTRDFKQQRDTSLSIYFDAPQFAEVRIPISAYIRTDVVFEPGKVDFGTVDFLIGGKKTIRIAYAGRPDWEIRDIRITSRELTAKLSKPVRNGGSIVYELEMNLASDAKPGRFRDIVTLVTDDASNPTVPLIVEAKVVPDISIKNPNIAIRMLKPGQTTIVRVVVQGNKPFLIEDVDCQKMEDCFRVKMSDKENTLQVVELEFTAPDKVGKFNEEMLVKLKGRPDLLKFMISGSISGG